MVAIRCRPRKTGRTISARICRWTGSFTDDHIGALCAQHLGRPVFEERFDAIGLRADERGHALRFYIRGVERRPHGCGRQEGPVRRIDEPRNSDVTMQIECRRGGNPAHNVEHRAEFRCVLNGPGRDSKQEWRSRKIRATDGNAIVPAQFVPVARQRNDFLLAKGPVAFIQVDHAHQSG
ncbi:hypothetical protein PQR46_18435 [Paraburkholderia sediminicola]|uniref:hypothetical protein n=1 Tax=Paraburkholderia sediminicola TaxID=458836 RepID=UPI0038BC5DD6